MYKKTKAWLMASLLAVFVFVAGCGGGGGGGGATDTTGTDTTIITGVASKGPIKNGTVKVYAITNGAKGTTPIGTTTTSDSGYYSVNIGAYTGAVIVEATGGTYTDEATAITKDSPGLSVAISNVQKNQTAAITPLTEIAVQKAIAVGGFTQASIDAANTVVSNMMGGINIVMTLPIDVKSATAAAASTDAQKQYSLMLAAISKIDATNGSVTVSDVIADIVADLSDGMLDDGAGSSISSALSAVTSNYSINQTGLTAGTMTIDESIQTATTTTISSVGSGTGSVTNPLPGGKFGVKIYKPTGECDPDDFTYITGLDGNPVPVANSGGFAGTITPYYYRPSTNSVTAGLTYDVSMDLSDDGEQSDSGGPYWYLLMWPDDPNRVDDDYKLYRIEWNVHPHNTTLYTSFHSSWPTHCERSGSAEIEFDGQLKNIVIQWDGTGSGGGAAQPTITGIGPLFGAAGTNVTIYGTGFNVTPANNAVTFNGAPATVTAVDTISCSECAWTTYLTVTVPQDATTGPVSVTTLGGSALFADVFTITPALKSTDDCVAYWTPILAGGSWRFEVTSPPYEGVTNMTYEFTPNTTKYAGYSEGSFWDVHRTLVGTTYPASDDWDYAQMLQYVHGCQIEGYMMTTLYIYPNLTFRVEPFGSGTMVRIK